MSVLANALFDGDVAEWLSGRCGQCDAEVYIELRVRVPLTAGETVGASRFCKAHWLAALRTSPPVQERERRFAEEVEEIRREHRRFVNDPAPSTFPHPSWSDVGILLAALRADPPVEQRERLKKEIGGECCCHYDDLED